MWKQHGGPIAPNFTYSATALTQALDPQCQATAQRDRVAEERTSAEECEPGGHLLYSSGGAGSAWAQQASRSKTTTKIQKTNTHTHARAHKHRDSHRSKVTRSTSTLRLHKTSPGTDNTTAPARRKQEGQRS